MELDIDRYLHDTLENSIMLENYLRNRRIGLKEEKTVLFEKHGMVPNIEQYINVFINFVKKYKNLYGEFVMTQNNFNKIENCFFANVQISVTKKDKGINNGYIVGDIIELNEEGKIDTLKMNFTLSGKDWNGLLNSARNLFGHELTHAYEIYMRLKKGQRPYTVDSYIKNYTAANNMKDSKDVTNLERKISYIIYYLFNFEVNAYAASMYTSLLYDAKNWKNPQDGMKFVEGNVTFMNYKVIYRWIEDIAVYYDKAEVERIWYRITNRRLSYSKIVKKMAGLYDKRWNQLRRVISKVCLDAFEKSRETPFKNEEIDLRPLF